MDEGFAVSRPGFFRSDCALREDVFSWLADLGINIAQFLTLPATAFLVALVGELRLKKNNVASVSNSLMVYEQVNNEYPHLIKGFSQFTPRKRSLSPAGLVGPGC